MPNQHAGRGVLEQPLHPEDEVQTTHTMEKLADGGPLEPQHSRPDLVELTPEEIQTLPRNAVE